MNDFIPNRQSHRLQGYDYHQSGAYFTTICTQNRACLFGEVTDDIMAVSDSGNMVSRVWTQMPQRFPNLRLDAFIVMPNHLHAIAWIDDIERNTGEKLSLGEIIGAFKSITTHEYILGVRNFGWPPFSGKLWQRDYYEHIIRNEHDLQLKYQYITENVIKWLQDREHPAWKG